MNEEICLSTIGKIVERCWEDIPGHFPDVELDAFITMPNHLHGIIVINESGRGEVTSPLHGAVISPLRKPTLGNMVAYFKYQSTKLINAMNRTPGDRFWQRNYYEHIIRDEIDLDNVREYITNNPLKWFSEKEFPDNLMNTLR
jgi:putative transposase